MIWGPFLLALALGLLVSAGLYFAYLWPQVEPEEPSATSAAARDDGSREKPEPASESAESEADPKVSETEPATEAPETPPPSKPDSPPPSKPAA